MAKGADTAAQRSPGDPGTDGDERAARLAELITELTGTARSAALHAVRASGEAPREPLELVADAMITLDQPPPEGFRVTRYVRRPGPDDDPLRPRTPGHDAA